MYHPKAGGPPYGQLWLEMVQFYCTGAKTTTTKEENGKKKDKKKAKKKKKASLRMGQSVLWRLLTLAGGSLVIFFVLCLFFVPRGKF